MGRDQKAAGPASETQKLEPTDPFVEDFEECLYAINKNLEDPDEAKPLREGLEVLRGKLKAEAASIFVVSKEDPNKLVCEADAGYFTHHAQKAYFLKTNALTSWVFLHGQPKNEGRKNLEEMAQRGDIGFSNSCRENILTRRFVNVIAVPIRFGNSKLGVLKIENKDGTSENEQFEPQDYRLTKALAPVIGMVLQQRRARQWWQECEQARLNARSRPAYLQDITERIARFLNSESCSIFLSERQGSGNEVLRYAAGVGYKDAYAKWEYPLDRESLTVHCYKSRAAFCYTEQELQQCRKEAAEGRELPYSGACRSYIRSTTFRGVLMVPLETERGDCFGVLKVENKLPDDIGVKFEQHDLKFCKALVRKQLVPTLDHFARRQPREPESGETEGFRLLVRQFHESRKFKREALRNRVREVVEFAPKQSQITVDDCARYLQISRPHFYRLKRDAMRS